MRTIRPSCNYVYFVYYFTDICDFSKDDQLSKVKTYQESSDLLGSKDLGFYVFRTLICIVGKPWSKQRI